MRTRPDVITDLTVGSRIVHLDEHGFLVDPDEWNAEVATALAAARGKSGRDLLFELFPYGYVGQACRISGMRQPRAWSTG